MKCRYVVTFIPEMAKQFGINSAKAWDLVRDSNGILQTRRTPRDTTQGCIQGLQELVNLGKRQVSTILISLPFADGLVNLNFEVSINTVEGYTICNTTNLIGGGIGYENLFNARCSVSKRLF